MLELSRVKTKQRNILEIITQSPDHFPSELILIGELVWGSLTTVQRCSLRIL